jgi:hypothetical protein
MKNTIIILLAGLSSHIGWTQKIQEITHREINVHFNDSSVKANVLLADKKQHLRNSTDYYWYYNNSIKYNQGDYKGRLLDGGYQVTLKDGKLITKGRFSKGSKSGEWKKWDAQGKLIDVTNWSKGDKDGKYQKYANGKLIEKGVYQKNKLKDYYFVYENEKLIEKRSYKKGILHGKQITYKSDTIFSEVFYKKGVTVLPKEKLKRNKDSELDKDSEKSETQIEEKWWQIWKKKEDTSKVKENQGNKNNTTEKVPKKEKKIKTKKRKEKEQRSKKESQKDD